MDRHAVEGTTRDALANAHEKDLQCQAKYGCKCVTDWSDETHQSIFCLVEATSRQAVQDMHRAALFGSTNNFTARIRARSQPDQIPAVPVIRDLCVGKLCKFNELGRVKSKGMPESVQLHEVVWQ